MSKKENKSPLESAIIDIQEIREFAKKNIEAQMAIKTEELIEKTLNEKLNESLTIKTDNVEVNIDGENVEIKQAGETATEDPAMPLVTEPETEEEEGLEGEELDGEAMEDEELFEIVNEDEQMQTQTQEMPAQEVPMEVAPEAEVQPEAGNSELDKALEMLGSAIKSMATGAAGATDEVGSEQIDIVDDDANAQAPAEVQPQQAPQAQPQQNQVAEEEMSDDELLEIVLGEESDDDYMMEFDIDETEEDEDILVDMLGDENGEEIDEAGMALGSAVKRSVDQRQKMATGNRHHSPVAPKSQAALYESKIGEVANKIEKLTAQYEAKIAELVQENKGLKTEVGSKEKEIEKFESSFTKLREGIHKLQTFNAKLAYTNKLLASGNFNQNEILTISERFEKVQSAEDAQKVYKDIISEGSLVVDKTEKALSAKHGVTSTKAPLSESKAVYETPEVSRWKQMAGITKNENL